MESSLEVSSGNDSPGSLSNPGAFTSEAGPGDFTVNLFASVVVSDEEKEQLKEQARYRFRPLPGCSAPV